MTYEQLQEINKNLKKTPIRGKNYADVASRIQGFRKMFPEGKIETEILKVTDDSVLIKATVSTIDGRILGTGHALEEKNASSINRTSFVENCETSAIGRALGAIGIGSDEFIASAEELNNAMEAQEVIKQTDKLIDTIIDMVGGDRDLVDSIVRNNWPGNKVEDLDYQTLVRLKQAVAKKITQTQQPETAIPNYNIQRRTK